MAVPELENETVHVIEELPLADTEDIVSHPLCMDAPAPETIIATDFAEVPPVFWMFRLNALPDPETMLLYEVGETDNEIDGGITTSKLDDSAVVGEPVIMTFAFIFTSFWVCDISAVVHVTLAVPSENDFDVPSSLENPEGRSIRLTEPEPDSPETCMLNVLPFITVPVSAPDCDTVAVAAYDITGTASKTSKKLTIDYMGRFLKAHQAKAKKNLPKAKKIVYG